MLANVLNRFFCVGFGMLVGGWAIENCPAQQPPSSRYQPVGYLFSDEPVQDAPVPPSVHIPPANAQSLPKTSLPSPQTGRNPNANSGPWPASNGGLVRQTTFQQESSKSVQEPTVPEILRRGNSAPTADPAASPASNANQSRPQVRELPVPPASPTNFLRSSANEASANPATHRSSPADYSSQLNQLRQTNPLNSKEVERVAQMKKDVDELLQRAGQKGNKTGLSEEKLPGQQSDEATFYGSIPEPVTAKTNPASPASADAPGRLEKNPNLNPTGDVEKPQRLLETLVENSRPNQAFDQTESVQDFLRAPKTEQLPQTPASMEAISDTRVQATAMQVTMEGRSTYSQSGSPGMDELNRKHSAIRLAAPAISIESFGPQSIGVNKPAIFKVVATNETNQIAERVMVSIDVPVWVEIDKINMTAGERQMADGRQQARLVWKIDQIPANGSQTLTLTAIPRKAEPFDLGIEWTIAPRAGTANIQVTQPKLEMTIVGPDEIHFGETVSYGVTLRNAGNGDAENVVVILSESLNGERGNLGNIPAGGVKKFEVNLVARTPGNLDLGVSAVSDNQAETTTSRKVVIRRANLDISISGPSLRYAGTNGQYLIKLSNTGDASAEEVVAALGLPTGVKFLGGIETFKLIDGGLRWQVGRLEPGQTREYRISCQMESAGDLQLEVGIQAKGALQAANACVTKVQTIADLVMQVNDPPGPLTTGDEITYEIVVQNRGTKPAMGVDIFMILSDGMEPKSGSGLEYRIPRDGALQFATIPQVDPGQKIALKVNAVAYKPGTHVFRAHLICEEADAREIKEGTSKFFGEEVDNPLGNTASKNSNFSNSDFQKNLK
jgi:uncharacterized repeat protein (TIGR01451 family)